MTNIQHKIELSIYGYDANEFMPIRDMDGRLVNKNQFIVYKTKRMLDRLLACNK